jgi:NAD(P)H dehydrogenase (quinone)
MMNMTEIRGGSAWGPGTFAGDGSRQVSQVELEHARYYGEQFAKVAKDLYEGRKLRASKL